MFGRGGVVLVLLFLAAAAPAHAVVGGRPVSATAVPWFATLSGCGGTLIAPDRVVHRRPLRVRALPGGAQDDPRRRRRAHRHPLRDAPRLGGHQRGQRARRRGDHPARPARDRRRARPARRRRPGPRGRARPRRPAREPDRVQRPARGEAADRQRQGLREDLPARPRQRRRALQRAADGLLDRRQRAPAALVGVRRRQRRAALHRQPRRAGADRHRQLRRRRAAARTGSRRCSRRSPATRTSSSTPRRCGRRWRGAADDHRHQEAHLHAAGVRSARRAHPDPLAARGPRRRPLARLPGQARRPRPRR